MVSSSFRKKISDAKLFQSKKGRAEEVMGLNAKAQASNVSAPTSPTQEVTPTSPTRKPDGTGFIKDEETGKITFVENSDGTFIHGSSKELKNILNKRLEQAKVPEGSTDLQKVARNEQLQAMMAQPQGTQDLGIQDQDASNLERSVKAGIGGV